MSLNKLRFKDVHTVDDKKHGIVKRNLSVNSANQRLKGSCPLMPEEIGIILCAYGYLWDIIIYVSGGEIFGGQRKLIPLLTMFKNVVDRTSLSIFWELSRIYGHEANLFESNSRSPPTVEEEMKVEAWKTVGPRPFPPPSARPRSYNIEGNGTSKFYRDGNGTSKFYCDGNGTRLYQSAASKIYRPDRKEVVRLLEEISDHLYHANHTWLMSVHKYLRKRLVDGLLEASTVSKSMSFIPHPVPECSCLRCDYAGKSINASTSTPPSHSQVIAALGILHFCPAWMENDLTLQTKGKKNEEAL
ncbi:O-fucosyltransferase 27-like [Rosa rugosa]|uniref:O-fucosyltransferase 27-like n=1 Tax=Rosa rugosa TaxID=74645 RepID=UPI002B418425|nr:O-fucosyltransferase 27-like [Rosa rugosa]